MRVLWISVVLLVLGVLLFQLTPRARAVPCVLDKSQMCVQKRDCIINCQRCTEKDQCCCKHVDRCECIEPASGLPCCD